MTESERRRAASRPVVAGLVVSAMVHAAVLSIPLRVPTDENRTGGPARDARDHATARRGLTIVTVTPVDARAPGALPSAATPAPTARLRVRSAPPDAPAPTIAGDGARSAASPGSGPAPPAIPSDGVPAVGSSPGGPRLWGPEVRELGAIDDWDAERVDLRRRIREAEREAAEAPREIRGMSTWARGPEERRWGVSPGRLHLGAWTVPTCGGAGDNAADCGFGLHPSRRIEFNARSALARELERQAAEMGVVLEVEERGRAIRARRDAERADSARARRPGGGQ